MESQKSEGSHIVCQRLPSPAPDRWRVECRGAKRPAFGVTAGRCSVDGMVRICCWRYFIKVEYAANAAMTKIMPVIIQCACRSINEVDPGIRTSW